MLILIVLLTVHRQALAAQAVVAAPVQDPAAVALVAADQVTVAPAVDQVAAAVVRIPQTTVI